MANADCTNCALEKRLSKAEERLEKGDKKFEEMQIAINTVMSDQKLDNEKISHKIDKMETKILFSISPLIDDLTERKETAKSVKRKIAEEIVKAVVAFVLGGGLVALISKLI